MNTRDVTANGPITVGVKMFFFTFTIVCETQISRDLRKKAKLIFIKRLK